MPFTVDQILTKLNAIADPEKVLYKQQKFGIISNNALGVYHKDLKLIAKEIKKDNNLAIALFDTDIYECRLLCSKIFDPKDLTDTLIEKWVKTFENWEICDSFCMGLFAKSAFAVPKIQAWHQREREFERRSAFTTIAAYCMADKKAANEVYENFFPLIQGAVQDDRIYVKKAVNWALRNIGKRNMDLNKRAIAVAKEILEVESKSAQWIAKDALRELEKPTANILDYPRSVYRP